MLRCDRVGPTRLILGLPGDFRGQGVVRAPWHGWCKVALVSSRQKAGKDSAAAVVVSVSRDTEFR